MNISAPLWVPLASGLPQNEVLELGMNIPAPLWVPLASGLPQNEVLELGMNIPAPLWVFMASGLPQDEVSRNILSLEIIMSWLNPILTLRVKSFQKLASPLLYGGKTLVWTFRNIPECLQHALRMYAWLLAENKKSVKFQCRLIALFLRQSFFHRHDFSAMVDKLDCSVQWWHTDNLGRISSCRKDLDHKILNEPPEMPIKYEFHGGGPSLVFSLDELSPYASINLNEMQYKFVKCVKTTDKHTYNSEVESAVLCTVPLNILAPKLTMKCIKDLASLHQIFIPARTLVKDAQMLLQEHKCDKCDDFICLFKPYKVQSNTQRQQNWYEKLSSDKKTAHLAEKAKYKASSEYQAKNREKHKADYWSEKEVKFPPSPPSAGLCQKIISDFCADTSPENFEESGFVQCVEN
jgi:hypothetical protein